MKPINQVRQYLLAGGSGTRREIAAALNMSVSRVDTAIHSLKGFGEVLSIALEWEKLSDPRIAYIASPTIKAPFERVYPKSIPLTCQALSKRTALEQAWGMRG